MEKSYLGTKTVCVVSPGMYMKIAERLARDFKIVYYHNPFYRTTFPRFTDNAIGEGLLETEGVEKINNFWDYIDEIDLFVFPDCGFADWSDYLKSIGKRVWASGKADALELERTETLEYLKELGLEVPKYTEVKGLSNLRKYLKTNEDVYVKTNVHRGTVETFHSASYDLIMPLLDKLEGELSIIKDTMEFSVFEPIEGTEVGFDSYVVNGQYPKEIVYGIEIKDCYDNQTEILTDTGWKLFKDLNRTEKVLTLNISDKRHIKYEYQKPIDYIERDYNGKLVYIEKDTVSLCITPTHNLLVNQGIQLENGEDLKWTSCLTGNAVSFKRGCRSLMLRPAIDLINENKRFSLFQPKGQYYSPNPSLFKIKIGDCLIGKEVFASFLGWYLSEGHARVKSNGKSHDVFISQIKYPDKLEACLSKTPFRYKRAKRGFHVFGGLELAIYLKNLGTHARYKFIPQWIKDSSVKIINSFLDAYCWGDGSFIKKYKKIRKDSRLFDLYPNGLKEKESRHFYTSSPQMRDDLQELIVKIGNVSCWYQTKKYFVEKEQRHGILWDVQEKVINRKNYIFPGDIQYTQYEDKVYCVTVPNSIIMVRRNGKSMWCGNCGWCGHVKSVKKVYTPVIELMDKICPTLKLNGYANFISTEMRVDKSGAYLTDFCCRQPSPVSEVYYELITNFSEILWHGGNGDFIEPEYNAEYAMTLVITSDWAMGHGEAVYFPKEISKWVKLRNYTIVDNIYYVIPNVLDKDECIGVVVAIGDSLEDCAKKINGYANQIKGYRLKVTCAIVGDMEKEIDKGKKFNISF